MQLQTKPPRWVMLSTQLFFLLQAVLALVYYKERLFLDAVYYLYHIIDLRSFRIEHQRFILAISQLLPLLGIWLGAKLKMVLILQSLNPVVYFYLLYLACWYGLRDYLAAIAMVLVQCIGLVTIYYCPMYEIWYGTGISILFFAMLRKEYYKGSPWRAMLFVLVEVTSLFSHPLVFIPMLLFIAMDFMDKGKKNLRWYLFFLLFFALMFVVKKLFISAYEGGKLNYMFDFKDNSTYLNLLHGDYRTALLRFLLNKYTSVVILFLASSGYYIYRKQYLRLLVSAAFFFGFIVLVNITNFGYSNEDAPYLERTYMSLVTIALLPFLYDVLTALPPVWQKTIAALLVVLVVYRETLIIEKGNFFVERHRVTQSIIACARQQAGSKFIYDETTHQFPDMEWSFSMETLIYSALEGPDKAISIVTTEDINFEGNKEKLKPTETLVRRWDIQTDKDLNQNYFRLKTGPYTALPDNCGR